MHRAVARFVEELQSPPVSRVTAERDAGRHVSRPPGRDPGAPRSDQAADAAATEAREFAEAASRGHSLGSVSKQRHPTVSSSLTTYNYNFNELLDAVLPHQKSS
jgi:hypothetical protein